MAATKNAREIFLEALEETPANRPAYLDEACGDDAALRRRVEALLRANDESGAFLSEPQPGLGDAAPLPPPSQPAEATVDSEPAPVRPERTGEYTPQPDEAPHLVPTTDYAHKVEPGLVIAGRYTLVQKIGEGGMGEIWVAKQTEPVKRKVALKLIKTGLDSKAVLVRFEQERQALAMMDHTNIARVVDGGRTPTGQPFFVMELVNGLPLNKFCDEMKLTPKQRLELFVPICQAVQHAHQKGIVHRDLKPANVLITMIDAKPVPKVIDFGVAKATAGKLTDESMSTQFGAVVGTLEYMSPEQAGFGGEDVDTRADIYSLGVILFEMLTGLKPIEAKRLGNAAFTEMIRIIREEEPSKPSTRLSTDESLPSLAALRQTEPRKLIALLSGELDWVVMKCLEKQRERRYETANGLARDIQRYLADEVVEARPPSTGYRLRKFVRRHKGQAIAVSLIALTLLMSTTVCSLKYLEAEEQKVIAEGRQLKAIQEADKAKTARDFLVSSFRSPETDVEGGVTTTRDILAIAEKRIPVEFANQPELRMDLVAAIGDVKRGIARRTPQAMLLEVSGTVQLQSVAGKRKAAVPQTLLNMEDRLTLGPDAQVQLVFLSDFHKERLKPGRSVIIDIRGCEPADAVHDRDVSIMMTFARLPKGKFYSGGGGGNTGTLTTLTEDFEIAVHLVTQGQWRAITGENPSWFSRTGDGRNAVMSVTDEELRLFPVEMVSWNDAQSFIEKLNAKERGHGFVYRLPTQWEWEYACRGGATSEKDCSYDYYFDKPSNVISSDQANIIDNGNYPTGDAPRGKYLGHPSRVGAYLPNRLGLYDMHGNVYEWCADVEQGGNLVWGRGGCWAHEGSYSRTSFRLRFGPTYRSFGCGLRLVRVPVRPQ